MHTVCPWNESRLNDFSRYPVLLFKFEFNDSFVATSSAQ